MAPLKPLRLRCSVQNYDWGRIGEESKVSRLFSSNSQSEIDPRKPYAELWMGTHPSGPSFVVGSGIDGSDCDLKSWVDENHGAVGEKVVEKWGRDLPFLFKVLSVAKALSIQAHPDKELARVLNKMHPSIYKDSNHKPEMAVALTEFEALCGFVSLEELKGVLNSVPEIVELVGHVEAGQVMNIKENDGEEKVKAVLKSIFTQLMSASKDAVSGMVSKMRNRLNIENKVRVLTEKEQLALQLEKQYPADVGVISSFFFNYVKLKPGEALYLGANEPHAYLYGECIECMATSDNVVRAGLTPKFRDVQTLCSMLTYKKKYTSGLSASCNSLESETRSFFFLFQFVFYWMAANLQRRGFFSFGKRFLQTKNSISVFRDPSPLVSDAASSRSRHFSVTPYDKNVDDGLRPSLVPDDVVEQHINKFWAPHPQTGVFGPSKEIGGENQTQPPPPYLDTDADTADGSVLDQKARFRPLEDVDKPISNLE